MVADHLGASLPTASRIVSKLVGKGYLARCESANDRRQMVLELTHLGRELVDAAAASTQAQMELELAQLTSVEWDQIRKGMGLLKGLYEAAGYPGETIKGVIANSDGPVSSRSQREHRQTAQV